MAGLLDEHQAAMQALRDDLEKEKQQHIATVKMQVQKKEDELIAEAEAKHGSEVESKMAAAGHTLDADKKISKAERRQKLAEIERSLELKHEARKDAIKSQLAHQELVLSEECAKFANKKFHEKVEVQTTVSLKAAIVDEAVVDNVMAKEKTKSAAKLNDIRRKLEARKQARLDDLATARAADYNAHKELLESAKKSSFRKYSVTLPSDGETLPNEIQLPSPRASVVEQNGHVQVPLDYLDDSWELEGTSPSPVPLMALSNAQAIALRFGNHLADMLHDRLEYPRPVFAVASTLPKVLDALGNNYEGNTFAKSFFFDAKAKVMYFRKDCLSTVESFAARVVHIMAHMKTGNLQDDASPEFQEELKSALGVCASEIFRARSLSVGETAQSQLEMLADSLAGSGFGDLQSEDTRNHVIDRVLRSTGANAHESSESAAAGIGGSNYVSTILLAQDAHMRIEQEKQKVGVGTNEAIKEQEVVRAVARRLKLRVLPALDAEIVDEHIHTIAINATKRKGGLSTRDNARVSGVAGFKVRINSQVQVANQLPQLNVQANRPVRQPTLPTILSATGASQGLNTSTLPPPKFIMKIRSAKKPDTILDDTEV